MQLQPQPQLRERKVIAIVGNRRSGKTTMLRCHLKKVKRAGGRPKIIDPNGNIPGGEWPGLENLDKWVKELIDRNERFLKAGKPAPVTCLVFDDCDAYLPAGPYPRPPYGDLFLRSAHIDLDLIVTCRRPQALSPALISGTDWIYFFQVSRADVNAIERGRTITHGAPLPSEKYQFTQIDPNSGEFYRGQTTKIRGVEGIGYHAKGT